MQNVLTIDVEDWYQTNDFDFPPEKWAGFEDRIERNTQIILEMLEQYQIKGTFFVLGCVAEKHPGLIRRIRESGHELGCHGGWHNLITRQKPDEFRKDLEYAQGVLEHISGEEVRLFRAPSWSISRDTLWVLEILEQKGFICDSSLQPFRTPLSGMKGIPYHPFYPVIKGKKLNILEFPPTVWNSRYFSLPFSGGLYLRVLPFSIIRQALKAVNRRRMGMVYTHPWEFDPQQPRLKVPLHLAMAHYFNLSTTQGKLDRLLKEFSFIPLGQAIVGKEFPVAELSK